MGAIRSRLRRWTDTLALLLHHLEDNGSSETGREAEDAPARRLLWLSPDGSAWAEDRVLLADAMPGLDDLERPPGRAAEYLPDAPPLTGLLTAHLLGGFCLNIDDLPVEKLPVGRSSSLLKYLLYHHQRRLPREALMEVLWPDADPEVSRNRLNVTMSNIRHTLRLASRVEIIQFEDSRYFITPALTVWLDVEDMETSL